MDGLPAVTACHHFDAHRCRSCTLLELPRPEQVTLKQSRAAALLPQLDGRWLPAVSGPAMGVRNKAKMVVTGTSADPVVGIIDADLRDCGLHEPALQRALPVLAGFITRASIEPYEIGSRRGELKHLLVTCSDDGELMVRFVTRSQEPVARIRKHLPHLLAELPGTRVVSVNLQPEPKAVIEGGREIVLHGTTLPMRVAGMTLQLRPQSFFQTNTWVAGRLYEQAAEWLAEIEPASVWDMYCGVGGFAVAAASYASSVTGIEIAPEAIESARTTAADLGLDARFVVGDATEYAVAADAAPDLVIVNPPRRGIGARLAGWLEDSGVRHVVYSSCNATTLASDLVAMPSLRPVQARLLDMFPNSDQFEVIVRLERRSG